MRKPPALAALFPTIRGELLAATFNQPARWWYLSELAAFLGTRPSSLQREVRTLVGAGVLQHRREVTRIYVRPDRRSPLFRELRGLVEKTAGVIPALRLALEPFEGIECAFVHGSVARGQEHALSDVDLLVVGCVGLADLAPALRKVETRIGREVNVTTYAPREFRSKVASGDHFVAAVLAGPMQFVKGHARDLGEAVGKPRRPKASNVEAGAR